MLNEIFSKRKSIRKYNGKPITDEQLDMIIKAALLSPSSRNKRPWEIAVVRDKARLEGLSQCKAAGSALIGDADTAIVVIADKSKSDVYIEDCSIVMTYMHLMATELNIGSCWVQVRLREDKSGNSSDSVVREVIGYGENYETIAILALGNTDDTLTERPFDSSLYGKVHRETF